MQNIKINYAEKRQAIEGFGCYAGREKDFFQDASRDSIMNALFQELQFSILRAEIYPSFSTTPGERNFDTDADLNIPPNDPYFNNPDQNEVIRRSQLWVLKTGQQYANLKKIVASVWSPPYYMKTSLLKKLSGEYYTEFAKFLADFIVAYAEAGIPIFALSPQNEPENIFSPWDVCLWLPEDTASFVNNNMKPTFTQRGLNTKIMIGESANWSIDCAMLDAVSLLINNKYVDILASHAYSLPNLSSGTVNYNTNPIGSLPSGYPSTWITESSATTSFDPSMTTGLQAAICFHKFLAVKEVNAFIFWLGMVRGSSNEALICSDGVGNYQLTKVYDVMGNYSRYIKENYCRITTNSAALASTLYVSAFKAMDADNISIIAINASNNSVPISIQLDQAPSSIQTLTPYTTPAALGSRWQAGATINISNGAFNTNLLPSSVTTFTSNEQE